MKIRARRIIGVFLLISAVIAAGIGYSRLPDTVYMAEQGAFSYKQGLLTAEVPAGGKTAAASASQDGSYNSTLKLLGMIPLKTVRVQVTGRVYLVPCGLPFGVKMFTDGVVVVGFGNVASAAGSICPAKNAGLKEGDIILSVGGRRVTGNSDLAEIVDSSGGSPLTVVYRREETEQTASMTPAAARDGSGWKAGMWVRDSTAGIGTLTFYDSSSGLVAGLGHAISDTDTGVTMPVSSGEMMAADIVGVKKGVAGAPGELHGVFLDDTIGDLIYNGETGVFGTLTGELNGGAAIPVAYMQEIETGAATILATVDGREPKAYAIEIEKVFIQSKNKTQNMVIRITDPELLDRTGGIVQGMSGCPIVQNGRLVGAVTHVFVNDPTRGYGIFVENMLATENGLYASDGFKEAA